MKIEIVTTRYRDNRNPFPGRITGIVRRPYKDRSHVLFRQMVEQNRLEREILLRQFDAEELERLADLAVDWRTFSATRIAHVSPATVHRSKTFFQKALRSMFTGMEARFWTLKNVPLFHKIPLGYMGGRDCGEVP